MQENLFRKAVERAKETNQLGLLIWGNYSVWSYNSKNMKPGDTFYDIAVSQMSKEEEATIFASCYGFSIPGIIAVSTKKLLSTEEFYNTVLNFCDEGNLIGPITLVPSGELFEI